MMPRDAALGPITARVGRRQVMNPLPLFLSNRGDKRSLYAFDPYFRQGWEDAIRHWGEAAERLVSNIAAVVLKPGESVAARKMDVALSIVAELDSRPPGWGHSGSIVIRSGEVWRCQINKATRARLAVMDVLAPATESLFVLLRDLAHETGESGSLRLSKMNGGMATDAHADSCRKRLGASSRLLSFVHVPDEPADLVREIAIHVAGRVRQVGVSPQRHPDRQLAATSSPLTSSVASPSMTSSLALASDSALM
jgi:hypothetical protein